MTKSFNKCVQKQDGLKIKQRVSQMETLNSPFEGIFLYPRSDSVFKQKNLVSNSQTCPDHLAVCSVQLKIAPFTQYGVSSVQLKIVSLYPVVRSVQLNIVSLYSVRLAAHAVLAPWLMVLPT